VPQDSTKETRRCPGENYDINLPICKARQRRRYTKCLLCPYRSEETDARLEVDETVTPSIFRKHFVLGKSGSELTEQAARKLGVAFVEFIRTCKGTASRVAMGRDGRDSSRKLAFSFSRGVTDAGMDVYELGDVTADVVNFAVASMHYDGGVMVTGSHYPKEYNGFCFCRENGTPIAWDNGLDDIAQIARQRRKSKPPRTGRVQSLDLLEDYKGYVLTFANTLRPMKVVIDASNGMAGKVTPMLFEDLPVEIVSLFFDMDGNFPGHPPNPLRPANLKAVRERVIQESAHFGAAFDGDGDRIVFIDDSGKIVDGDVTGALIARELLSRQPGGIVVYDLRCSANLREEIKAAGGKPLRTRAGFAFLRKAMNTRDAVFGAGLTGEYLYRDFFGCASGMVTLIQMLNLLSKSVTPLSSLVASVKRYVHSGEMAIPFGNAQEAADKLVEVEPAFADGRVDKLDGLTVAYSNWWFNLRQDGPEARLRLNVEGKTQDVMDKGKQRVLSTLRGNG